MVSDFYSKLTKKEFIDGIEMNIDDIFYLMMFEVTVDQDNEERWGGQY
jgi:hypothetical protein